MAKADLRKPENTAWLVIGQAMNDARQACGLSVKEFADKVQRDEAQVRRWFSGGERPQVDVVFAVREFRKPFIVALAKQAGAGVEIETTVRIREVA